MDWDAPVDGWANSRIMARNEMQSRDYEDVAEKFGCTVEELKRQTADGWTAPLEDEIDELREELSVARDKLRRVERVLTYARCGSLEYFEGAGDVIMDIRAALGGG